MAAPLPESMGDSLYYYPDKESYKEMQACNYVVYYSEP
jgi:hypothetical protein